MYRRFVKHNCVVLFIHCHGMRLHCVFTFNSSVNAAAEVPWKRHNSGYHKHTPSGGFFLFGRNLSFSGRQSTVSMVFSRALSEKVPSSLNQ